MNKLLILCFAIMMSCTGTTAQKSEAMQKKGEIIMSESQGGTDLPAFKILKNQKELEASIKEKQGLSLVETGSEPVAKYPEFPANGTLVLYEMGRFNSGDHTIREIKSLSVQDNVLYVEVPMYESGGMEIQVLSNPWFIFTVPASYKFTSVQLKPTK